VTTEPLEPARPPSQRGPAAATVLVGALLVLVGVGWLLDASGVEVPWRAVLPAALIAVGLATVAGAFRDRQPALLLVGLLLVAVLTVASAADWNLPVGGGVGDRTERPSSPADLRDYRLAIGQLTLDLSGLQVPQGTTTVQARVGVGELAVRLPEGVPVEVDAGSGIGQVQALDREESGVGSRLEADSGGFGDRRLVLDLRVGLGEVRVER
jgi:Cell wall-active antibiotics response LiaF, C-terminal